jgi:acetyl-CoA acyltransferase
MGHRLRRRGTRDRIGRENLVANLHRRQCHHRARREDHTRVRGERLRRFSREILPIGDFSVYETLRSSTTVEGLAGLKPAFYDEELGKRFPENTDWRITPSATRRRSRMVRPPFSS